MREFQCKFIPVLLSFSFVDKFVKNGFCVFSKIWGTNLGRPGLMCQAAPRIHLVCLCALASRAPVVVYQIKSQSLGLRSVYSSVNDE